MILTSSVVARCLSTMDWARSLALAHPRLAEFLLHPNSCIWPWVWHQVWHLKARRRSYKDAVLARWATKACAVARTPRRPFSSPHLLRDLAYVRQRTVLDYEKFCLKSDYVLEKSIRPSERRWTVDYPKLLREHERERECALRDYEVKILLIEKKSIRTKLRRERYDAKHLDYVFYQRLGQTMLPSREDYKTTKKKAKKKTK